MNERGGAVYGLLAAIGAVVVIMAVIFAVCMGNAGAARPNSQPPSVHRYRDCDQDWGDCDQRQQHRGNFSPGPFDRSPVDVHDNDVCVSLNCAGYGTPSSTTTTRR